MDSEDVSWEDTSSEDTGYASHSEMADADESIIANIICPRCGQGGFLSERNLRRHIERRGERCMARVRGIAPRRWRPSISVKDSLCRDFLENVSLVGVRASLTDAAPDGTKIAPVQMLEWLVYLQYARGFKDGERTKALERLISKDKLDRKRKNTTLRKNLQIPTPVNHGWIGSNIQIIIKVMNEVRRDPELDCTLKNLKLSIDMTLADIGLEWPPTNRDLVKDRSNKLSSMHRYITSSPLIPADLAMTFTKGRAEKLRYPEQCIGVYLQQKNLRENIIQAWKSGIHVNHENILFLDEIVFKSCGRMVSWSDGVAKVPAHSNTVKEEILITYVDVAGVWTVFSFYGGPRRVDSVIMVDTQSKKLQGTLKRVGANVCLYYSDRHFVNATTFEDMMSLVYQHKEPTLTSTDDASTHMRGALRILMNSMKQRIALPGTGNWTAISALCDHNLCHGLEKLIWGEEIRLLRVKHARQYAGCTFKPKFKARLHDLIDILQKFAEKYFSKIDLRRLVNSFVPWPDEPDQRLEKIKIAEAEGKVLIDRETPEACAALARINWKCRHCGHAYKNEGTVAALAHQGMGKIPSNCPFKQHKMPLPRGIQAPFKVTWRPLLTKTGSDRREESRVVIFESSYKTKKDKGAKFRVTLEDGVTTGLLWNTLVDGPYVVEPIEHDEEPKSSIREADVDPLTIASSSESSACYDSLRNITSKRAKTKLKPKPFVSNPKQPPAIKSKPYSSKKTKCKGSEKMFKHLTQRSEQPVHEPTHSKLCKRPRRSVRNNRAAMYVDIDENLYGDEEDICRMLATSASESNM